MSTASPVAAIARPRITLSWAQTLDGRLATVSGSSQWISGPESLRMVHQLRATHHGIMVGAGTVARDNPRLTVRLVAGPDPLRVVVDSTLRTPLDAAVLAGDAARGTLLAVTERAPQERVDAVTALGATVLVLPSDPSGRVALPALLAALHAREVDTLMVEGGAQLLTALLRGRLADRMVVTVAPKMLGSGIAAIGDLGISDLAAAYTLEHVSVTHYGVDIVIDGNVAYPEQAA
jgi:riboflavin-specific deaminase-like protein